ncbi:hypothetical protein V5N34_29375 [Streptomyces baarnensis]|uniref:hypothetical protein n=1 Tax=Streptomyces baarnensis TaxID=66872 RepID=UPI00308219BD
MSKDYRDGAEEQTLAWKEYMAEQLADCPQPPAPAAQPEPPQQQIRTHDENGNEIIPW